MNSSQSCKHELLAEVVTGRLFGSPSVLCVKVEKRCLLRSMFAQFCHLVDAAANILLLFSLTSPLCFVPLSLLPCVFLLTLREC
jgi:hypothetical protein